MNLNFLLPELSLEMMNEDNNIRPPPRIIGRPPKFILGSPSAKNNEPSSSSPKNRIKFPPTTHIRIQGKNACPEVQFSHPKEIIVARNLYADIHSNLHWPPEPEPLTLPATEPTPPAPEPPTLPKPEPPTLPAPEPPHNPYTLMKKYIYK